MMDDLGVYVVQVFDLEGQLLGQRQVVARSRIDAYLAARDRLPEHRRFDARLVRPATEKDFVDYIFRGEVDDDGAVLSEG
jgi:hypothetical protein